MDIRYSSKKLQVRPVHKKFIFRSGIGYVIIDASRHFTAFAICLFVCCYFHFVVVVLVMVVVVVVVVVVVFVVMVVVVVFIFVVFMLCHYST